MSNLYVYVFGSEDGQPIKVGVSNNPKERALGLSSCGPFCLKVLKKWRTQNAFELERIAHHELREHKMNGEWFSCSSNLAIEKIDALFKSTKGGKCLEAYEKKKGLFKSISAIRAGKTSGLVRSKQARAGVEKIRDRWPLPSQEWPTRVLIEEAGCSLNTVKAVLGRRPIAQANYQAAQKRKEKLQHKVMVK